MSAAHGMKKPSLMASREFARMFDQMSKAAIVDALWCACQLGTNETDPEIATQAARNAVIALKARGDRIPRDIAEQATLTIDSDPVR